MTEQLLTLDCHIHYAFPIKPEDLIEILEMTKTDRANLVVVPHRQRISSVPDALMVKHMFPEKIYVFSSLDVTQYFIHHQSVGIHFVKYVKQMLACGCDGVKMIEGKPDLRRSMPIPDFDLPAWEPFWEYAEKSGLPILWHVNDPEEFWNPDTIPTWAKSQGWLYGKETINNEVQYTQVLKVLSRHPRLKIIFAHFFFMSAQLARLATILDQFPQVCIDLTPGIEMYINLSRNRDESASFFDKYQDRILYGTDIGARSVLSPVGKQLNKLECTRRATLVRTFLSESTEQLVHADGNFLIGSEDFTLRGIGLSHPTQSKILSQNFLRIVGGKPSKVIAKNVVKECKRIKLMIRIMSLIDKKLIPDYSYANQALTYFKTIVAKEKK
jgi:hypothetical protein